MPSDYTFFRFDVDEDTVRWLLSSLPGVTPLPPADRTTDDEGQDEDRQFPGDRQSPDDSVEVSDGDRAETAGDRTGTASDPTPGVTDGRPGGRAGSEAHLDDANRGVDQVSTRPGGAPSTPWPGAPTDEDEADQGLLSRLRERKVLVAAALVTALGAVAGGVFLFLRMRGDGSDDDAPGEDPDDELWSGARPNDPDVAETAPGPESSSAESDGANGDVGARSYPMDASPLVGIGFLAVVTVLLRRFRSSDGV